MARYKLNKRDTKSDESIPSYVAELRDHCSYGANLTEMLRDRLVCGIQNTKIQQKLLVETELTLKNAVKISIAMEKAQRDLGYSKRCE